MTKKELCKNVSETTGHSHILIGEILDQIFNEISDSISRGEKVTISGFGVFESREFRAKKVMDFEANEQVNMPSRVLPHFRASDILKEKVKGV